MFITILVIHIFAAISLVLVVLLQSGRGAELGAAFGGVGHRPHEPYVARTHNAIGPRLFTVETVSPNLMEAALHGLLLIYGGLGH